MMLYRGIRDHLAEIFLLHGRNGLCGLRGISINSQDPMVTHAVSFRGNVALVTLLALLRWLFRSPLLDFRHRDRGEILHEQEK